VQKLRSDREEAPQPLILIVKPAPASREHPGTERPTFSRPLVRSGCDQLSAHHLLKRVRLVRGIPPHRHSGSSSVYFATVHPRTALLHLKIHHGFERMRLRGLSGARNEFRLAAIVQNLKTPNQVIP
jgi:hypothetical protein